MRERVASARDKQGVPITLARLVLDTAHAFRLPPHLNRCVPSAQVSFHRRPTGMLPIPPAVATGLSQACRA